MAGWHPARWLAACLLLGACSGAAPRAVQGPAVPLPPPAADAPSSAGDPGRGAVIGAAFAFAEPARLAGRPAAAARAAGQLEWMAASLPFDQGWIGATPLTFVALAAGRAELRAALGIGLDAPPDAVAAALGRAALALDRDDRAAAIAALDPITESRGGAALRVLDAMPRLPRAATATSLAMNEMMRIAQEDPGL
jgi:hypothetical protein